jgi:hypothetical protein
MSRVELIYFGQCPNIESARSAIREAGVNNFTEINQDHLSENDPYMNFSSPSILVNGELVAGSQGGGPTCSLITWNSITSKIKGIVNHE